MLLIIIGKQRLSWRFHSVKAVSPLKKMVIRQEERSHGIFSKRLLRIEWEGSQATHRCHVWFLLQ